MIVKKTKGKKDKGVKKRNLEFEDYKHCLVATQLENKISKSNKEKLMLTFLEKIT